MIRIKYFENPTSLKTTQQFIRHQNAGVTTRTPYIRRLHGVATAITKLHRN